MRANAVANNFALPARKNLLKESLATLYEGKLRDAKIDDARGMAP